MKRILKYVILSLLFFPSADAIVPNLNYEIPGNGVNQDQYAQAVSAVSGVIAAGGVGVSFNHPNTVSNANSRFQISAFLTGPDLASALVPDTVTWALTLNGCSAGTPNQIDLFSVTSDTSSYTVAITMTSEECSGILTVTQQVGVGVVTIAHFQMGFNTNTQVKSMYSFDCEASGTQSTVISPGSSICVPKISPQDSFSSVAYTQSCAPSIYISDLSLIASPGISQPCVRYPSTVNPSSQFRLEVSDRRPRIIGGNTFSVTASNVIGCTFGSFNYGQTNPAGNDIEEFADVAVTMTGNLCTARIQAIVTAATGPTVLSNHYFEISIKTNADTISISSWPTLITNTAITGSLTLSGTINTVQSGTTHVVIDSWPTLISTVTNSGTINIQNTVGQTFALSGTLNTVNSGTINNVNSGSLAVTNSGTVNNVLSGSLTITNQGGQSIVVTSWPQLQAVLSGNLNVHQDQACGTTTHCQFDIHQDQACGATIVCESSVNSTVVIGSANVTNNQSSTLNVQLSLLPYYLLLIAVAFFAVFADLRQDGLYWFIDLILSIYLLLIRPENSIIPRAIFLGWIFVVAYQAIALLANKKATNLTGEE